jgi:hypothetical protein
MQTLAIPHYCPNRPRKAASRVSELVKSVNTYAAVNRHCVASGVRVCDRAIPRVVRNQKGVSESS